MNEKLKPCPFCGSAVNYNFDMALEPMRKKGRWKRRLVDSGFNADWHCSECGWETALEEHGYNYCPHCGADMRGEKANENNIQ